MIKHSRDAKKTSIVVLGAVVLAAGCAIAADQSSSESDSLTLAASTSVQPNEAPALATTGENGATEVPARDQPPVLRPGPIPTRPSWAGAALALQTDDVLDVTIVPEDSKQPVETNEWILRVFADADPDAINDLTAAMLDLGVAVEPAVFTCPYSAEEFDAVIEFLESFEWSDDGGRTLQSPRLGPNMGEIGRAGWGRCAISFPLERVSETEVDHIREFALERRVDWIDFWAGLTGEMFNDPLADPPGGLPYIRVPHACPDSGCVGDEADPLFFD